ncbi:FtsX-like permease family protein, partial [candidate division KSB1 bacterium]|nr:FtsX-like permease family protein [candidate division KSB1 bacterium]
LPAASMIRPDLILDWGSHSMHTYLLLHKEADVAGLEQKISTLIKEQLPEEQISLTLQPLKNIHLYTIDGKPAGMKYVYFFSAIAIFILAIACINFINLSTARSEKRAKEVGLRKVVGADRSQLIKQFFGESIVFTLIALVLALILIEIFQTAFNNITGKNFMITNMSGKSFFGIILITIFTGLISGSYPALFLSSFQPVAVLKGTLGARFRNKSFRTILVIVQFALSTMLLIGTGVIYHQLQYVQNKDLGYNKENVLFFRMNRDIQENYDVLRNELLQHQDIVGISRASALPTETWAIMRGITWEGKESSAGAAFGFAAIDHDYIETLNLEMAQGRNFSIKFPIDTANFIFNEKAINVMGMTDPVGKLFALDEESRGTIVGVVKDFHFLPLTYAIEPLILLLAPDYYRFVLVKIRPHDIKETIRLVEAAWKKLAPEYPFEYHFLDERFEENYREELRAGKIFQHFVMIAILISCLGLLGLASFTAEQKTKEIGIRKILGASIPGILILLLKEFTRWIILSNIIAWPIAYFAMNNWLQHFAYRIDISWWMFIAAGSVALLIAFLTVSYQTFKAAMANPVESLKYE